MSCGTCVGYGWVYIIAFYVFVFFMIHSCVGSRWVYINCTSINFKGIFDRSGSDLLSKCSIDIGGCHGCAV